MPNYEVHAHSRMVFPALTRLTGETVEADNGDVVQLHADVAEDTILAYVDAGFLKATSSAASPWPAVVEAVDAAEVKKTAKQIQAEIKKAEREAAALKVAEEEAAQAAAEAERLAAEKTSGESSGDTPPEDAPTE